MRFLSPAWRGCLLLLAMSVVAAADEVNLSSEEYARLDAFEQQILKRADDVFNDARKLVDRVEYLRSRRQEQEAATVGIDAERKLASAVAEYESFVVEFQRSAAVPYALLRKARSLHLADKRFQAIRQYQEILDFFPNSPKFAGSALYYIGLCHFENGDVSQAMRAWKQMADDTEYSKQPLAAAAVNQLAQNLIKQNQHQRAMQYYMQVAVDFRKSNPDAARAALGQVVPYYVRQQPDEPVLRKFYTEVGTFEHNPREAPKDVAADSLYWQRLREAIKRLDDFKDLQVDLKRRYYGYWAAAMEGKFPDDDDFQIDYINFKKASDGDVERWMARLDRQFSQFDKGNYDRIVKWIRAYAGHPKKVQEFFQKLNFASMSNNSIFQLLRTAVEDLKNPELAQNVVAKFHWDQAKDGWLLNPVLNQVRHYRIDEIVEEICKHFEEDARGRRELMQYYLHYRQNADKGLPIATELVSHPDWASEAQYYRGYFLQMKGKHEEAVAAYRQADSYQPPAAKFRMAECFSKLGKLSAAVSELKEIENFFKNDAPEARWRTASLYQEAGDAKNQVANLRALVKLYPTSNQASQAHQILEKMGVKVGGGFDAE